MVPTYGRQAMLGTNPIAFAMPADPHPFSFDAATTVVPRGKLEVYNKKEQPLPEDWALDVRGHGSTDAQEVLHNIIHKLGGGILPLGGEGETHGGHKGYGYGMICEICTAILAGGPTSNHCSSTNPDGAKSSQCFWAVDYGLFGEKTQIRRRLSDFLEEMRRTPTADGCAAVYVQGDKEEISRCQRLREGIPVNDKTLAEMQKIAGQLGLDFDSFFDRKIEDITL